MASDIAVIIALIAAAGTILAAAVTVALSRRADRAAAAFEARRVRKTQVYDSFLDYWFRALMHEQMGVENWTPEESGKWFVDFTKECIPWASDGFIKAYGAMRRNFFAPPDATQTDRQRRESRNLPMFEATLFEIRKDLGHNNKDLDEKSLLALWINDIDWFVPEPMPEPTPANSVAAEKG